MMDQEQWMDLMWFRPLRDAGASWAEIGRLAGCDWRTARKYLTDACPRPPRHASRPSRPKLVDPYREVVDA